MSSRLNTVVKHLLFGTLLVAEAALTIYLVRKLRCWLKKDDDDDDVDYDGDDEPMYRTLFYLHKVCDNHSNKQKECNVPGCFNNSLLIMRSYLRDAKISLDVCLYLITLEDMAVEIINAHQRGVKVRVISDANMSVTNGSKIDAFRQSGIEVRLRTSSFLMHHKFVVLDNQLAMAGSLNWTMQGIFGNWDNVVITTDSDVVDPFSEEFNRLWKILEDNN